MNKALKYALAAAGILTAVGLTCGTISHLSSPSKKSSNIIIMSPTYGSEFKHYFGSKPDDIKIVSDGRQVTATINGQVHSGLSRKQYTDLMSPYLTTAELNVDIVGLSSGMNPGIVW